MWDLRSSRIIPGHPALENEVLTTGPYLNHLTTGPSICHAISWQVDGETMETVRDFILGGPPKSLQMVTAAMRLNDSCSLKEKL